MDNFEIISTAIAAFLCVVIIVPVAIKVALRVGFVDAPGGRKRHDKPIPPIGGLIIFPVVILIHAFTQDNFADQWSLYVGVIALLVIGMWDDRTQINAWVKFGVQIAVSCLVVFYGDCRIDTLGNMFGLGEIEVGFMAIPFSIAAVALLINAINLMDGLDGLAGGQSFLIICILIAITGLSGALSMDLLPIAGALAGFLVYNIRSPWRKRASLFLGDSGTLALGLTLAWYSIALANNPAINLEPINVAWILALPIMDECAQFYRRVREGRHPFSPDRGHFHHHFMAAGFTVDRATPAILLFSSLLGIIAYVLTLAGVPLVILTLAWITGILTHMHLSQSGSFYQDILKKWIAA